MRQLPVTWGWAVVFAGYSGFLHYLQLASHELATICHTKFQIPKLIEKTLLKAEATDINSVEHILEIDNLARIEANKILNKF